MDKILIVAPNLPDLANVPDEAASLSNRFDSVLLQGTVTRDRVISAIEAEGRFEGIWFATHGGATGVLLSNGETLGAYDIASIANTAGCEWVVLNTCDSRLLVSAIQTLSNVDIVATETEQIADPAASQFARLAAVEYMQNGGNLKQAVRVVAPGSSIHRFYQNERNTMVRQYNNPPQTDQTLEDKIDLLMGLVEGDARRGVKGLMTQNQEILDRLKTIETHQKQADDERSELSAKLTTAYYILIIVGLGGAVATLAIVWLFATGAA